MTTTSEVNYTVVRKPYDVIRYSSHYSHVYETFCYLTQQQIIFLMLRAALDSSRKTRLVRTVSLRGKIELGTQCERFPRSSIVYWIHEGTPRVGLRGSRAAHAFPNYLHRIFYEKMTIPTLTFNYFKWCYSRIFSSSKVWVVMIITRTLSVTLNE